MTEFLVRDERSSLDLEKVFVQFPDVANACSSYWSLLLPRVGVRDSAFIVFSTRQGRSLGLPTQEGTTPTERF